MPINNFRENLKKAFTEGFSVNDIYAANNSKNYQPKIVKEADDDLDDPKEDDIDDKGDNDDINQPSKNDDSGSSDSPVSDASSDNSDVPSDSKHDNSDKEKNGEEDSSGAKHRPIPEPITPPTPIQPQETPEQKVKRLYSDTGDINQDYSITSESNIRLAKFKFDNAGIKVNKVISEAELSKGISTKDIENRLTPEQNELYKEKNRELRKKYPLIDIREKMVLIHNARIPMMKRDEKYNEVKIDKDQTKQAYLKLNAYLEEHFTKHWQDKLKYIDFLKTIKVNFSDKPAIRANLINTKTFINEDNENIIPLCKVYSQMPKSVQELILDNSDDETFKKSNIFRTLNSSFDQEVASANSLYVILNSENMKVGDGNNDSEGDEESDKEEDKNPEESDKDENKEEPKPEEEEPKTDAGKEDEEGLVPIGKDVEI
jgi:hypothetical protein